MDGDWRTILIYPTKNKRDTQHLFARPFNLAYGDLESPFNKEGSVRVLLAIGYGFGDEEIREIVERGLMTEKESRLIVVDPNATSERISALFPKVNAARLKVIAGKFGDESTLDDIKSEVIACLNTSC